MRNSRHFVSLRTFSLAFAVALSPVWLQTPSGCEPGDGTLSTLELEAAGQNQIAFDPEQVSYSVWLPVGVEPVLVRAYSTDPAATVWYKLDASVTIARGKLPNGGGEFTLDTIPSGQSTLTINVTSPSGLVWGTYTVAIGVGDVFPCTEQGIRDAIAAGGGPHTFECVGPTTVDVVAADVCGFPGVNDVTCGFVIDKDVILDGGGNLILDSKWSITVLVDDPGVTAELRGFTLTGLLWYQTSCSYGRCCGWCGTIGILNLGTLTVADSTVSGHASGISSWGALTVRNSTVSGNHVGVVAFGLQGDVVTDSTISAGDDHFAVEAGAPPAFTRTIVDGACDVSGPGMTSNGYNIESPGNTCGFDQATDQVNVTAEQLNLGPLQDNGGPTMTHALLPGSVAIDQIPQADCVDADGTPLTSDQRGVARPQGTACDVGAFELEQ